MRLRSDLSRLMIDPLDCPETIRIGRPEDHPDYLVSFRLGALTWHAFKAYPGEHLHGWTLQAGSYYRGSSDSLDDFLSNPEDFVYDRDGWRARGRPGWECRDTVSYYPDLNHQVTVKFVSDPQWQESGIEDPV